MSGWRIAEPLLAVGASAVVGDGQQNGQHGGRHAGGLRIRMHRRPGCRPTRPAARYQTHELLPPDRALARGDHRAPVRAGIAVEPVDVNVGELAYAGVADDDTSQLARSGSRGRRSTTGRWGGACAPAGGVGACWPGPTECGRALETAAHGARSRLGGELRGAGAARSRFGLALGWNGRPSPLRARGMSRRSRPRRR